MTNMLRLIVFASAILTAVPAVVCAQDAQSSAPKPAISASTETGAAHAATDAVIGAPLPGKAQIVFFRERRILGMVLNYRITDESHEVGRLGNGRYFTLAVDPGKHSYAVSFDQSNVLPIEVESGKTYYIQVAVSAEMAFVSPALRVPAPGEPLLSQSEQTNFEKIATKLKVSASNK